MTNWLLWDIQQLLKANEGIPEFQEAVRKKSALLFGFLIDNDLIANPQLKVTTSPPEDLAIWSDDLNEMGNRLFTGGIVSRWLGRNDDVRKPITTKTLENGLKKLHSATTGE